MKIINHTMVNIAEFGLGSIPTLNIAIMHLGYNKNGNSKYAISEQDLKHFRKGGSKGLKINATGYHVFNLAHFPSVNAAVKNLLTGSDE